MSVKANETYRWQTATFHHLQIQKMLTIVHSDSKAQWYLTPLKPSGIYVPAKRSRRIYGFYVVLAVNSDHFLEQQ
jgi:hypothetical protein